MSCAPAVDVEFGAYIDPDAVLNGNIMFGIGNAPFQLLATFANNTANQEINLKAAAAAAIDPRLSSAVGQGGIGWTSGTPDVAIQMVACTAELIPRYDSDPINEQDLELLARSMNLRYSPANGSMRKLPTHNMTGTYADNSQQSQGFARRCRAHILDEPWTVNLRSEAFDWEQTAAVDVGTAPVFVLKWWGMAWNIDRVKLNPPAPTIQVGGKRVQPRTAAEWVRYRQQRIGRILTTYRIPGYGAL